MPEPKFDPYYVVIEDPLELKKEVLQSQRQLLQSLQASEELKSMRDMKMKAVDDLKGIFKEIMLLTSKLKTMLPKVKDNVPEHLYALIHPEEEEQKEEQKPHPTQVKRHHKLTTMEKLERELADVEKQLSKLV